MIALDLFCGAGGASKGLLDAGFRQVIGVDNDSKLWEQHITRKDFVCFDVFSEFVEHSLLRKVDFVWASPPCQAYSFASGKWRNKGKKYPDLIGKTRKLLLKIGKPFVIENVVGSPLRKDLVLCGGMFGLKLIRHRVFEVYGFECEQPEHVKHRKPFFVEGKKKKRSFYCSVAGHGGDGVASLKAWQDAMEINWVSDKKVLAQCVPPKYSEFIGRQFLGLSEQTRLLVLEAKK